MTFKEFIDNPVGKGDTSINVSLITNSLLIKYNNSYSSDKKDKKVIEMKVFHQPVKDIYWIWLVIPSETGRGNSYDVVYKFINPKSTDRTSLSISKFDIQVFANSPSFAYTYSYVYNQKSLLVPELSSKLGKTFMNKAPDTRNRNQIVLFDKYIYFGAKYIMDTKVLNRAVADVKAKKFDEKLIIPRIRTLDTIMKEYHQAEEKNRGEKLRDKTNKKEYRKLNREKPSDNVGVNLVSKNSGNVKNVARSKPVTKRKGTIKKI